MPLLELHDVSVVFGGLAAVNHVSLSAEEGMVTGLIGPNGAGKTTMIDVVTGLAPIATGTILFEGHQIEREAPHRRVLRGLSRTFQSLELFEDLSVRDNLQVAAERPAWWSPFVGAVLPRRDEPENLPWVLDTLGLKGAEDRMPSELSHGGRRRLGIARALVARPRLLLLDEPAAGLDTTESAQLGEQIRRLPELGTSIMLIDHDMSLVLGICDTISVLDFGKVIASGTPAEIRSNERVIQAYLGAEAESAATKVESGT